MVSTETELFKRLAADVSELNLVDDERLHQLAAKYPWAESVHKWVAKKAHMTNSSTASDKISIAAIYSKDRAVLYDFMQQKLRPELLQHSAIVDEPKIAETEIVLKHAPAEGEVIAAEPAVSHVLEQESVQTTNVETNETNTELLSVPIIELPEMPEEDVVEPAETDALGNASGEPLISEEMPQPIMPEATAVDRTAERSFLDWLKAGKQAPAPEPETEQQDDNTWREELLDTPPYAIELEKTGDIPGLESSNAGLNSFIDTQINRKAYKTEYSAGDTDMPDDFMITETLAKLYISQKKYDKAIYAYKRLALKFPEKSHLFAALAEKIENEKK